MATSQIHYDSLTYVDSTLTYVQLKTKKPWNPMESQGIPKNLSWVSRRTLILCALCAWHCDFDCSNQKCLPRLPPVQLRVQSEDSSWRQNTTNIRDFRSTAALCDRNRSLQSLKPGRGSVPQPQPRNPRTWSQGTDLGFGAEGPDHIMSCH